MVDCPPPVGGHHPIVKGLKRRKGRRRWICHLFSCLPVWAGTCLLTFSALRLGSTSSAALPLRPSDSDYLVWSAFLGLQSASEQYSAGPLSLGSHRNSLPLSLSHSLPLSFSLSLSPPLSLSLCFYGQPWLTSLLFFSFFPLGRHQVFIEEEELGRHTIVPLFPLHYSTLRITKLNPRIEGLLFFSVVSRLVDLIPGSCFENHF